MDSSSADDEDEETEEPDDEEPDEEEEAPAAPAARRHERPTYPPAPCYITVTEGDCIVSLAARYQLPQTRIWLAPENEELRSNREETILMPGDRVFIPAAETRTENCETEQRHQFKLKHTPCKLKLKLLKKWEPRANLPYELDIDGQTLTGSTDGDGVLEVDIPPSTTTAILRLQDGEFEEKRTLALGHLDPDSETSGVQARLNNLGFSAGAIDGDAGDRTNEAVAAFQASQGLRVTGNIDDQTRRKLKELHES
jgi:hypothetical protein